MKTIAVAAFGAALLAPGVVLAADAQNLEVRFCPAAQVRTYPLESRRNIQGLLLQNTAVVNHGSAQVALTEVDIDLLQGGAVVDARRITGDELTKLAASGPRLQASGMMQVAAFQFCGDKLIANGVKLGGPALDPGQAMLLTYQPFAYKGARDTLRVTVRGKAGAADVTGSASLPVVQTMSKTQFRFPLKGVWFAAVGPTPHTAHRWGLPEEFAFDIAKIGDGNLSYRGDGTKFEDYYAYGADVLAAADGKVVAAVDGMLEDTAVLKRPGESDDAYGARVQQYQAGLLAKGEDALGGNFVMIDHGNNEYSLYAHLRTGSVKVTVGETVKAGQPIGKLGSSGNSSEPHLHFQVCDAPRPLSCAGVPIAFTNVRLPYADYPRPPQSGDIVIAD
jgi:murein DD-endopeptidase MepM/ murein hydrolase activator NlpD